MQAISEIEVHPKAAGQFTAHGTTVALSTVSLARPGSEESSPDDFASSGSDSDVKLYFTNLEGRASPADFTAAVTAALFMPLALDQEGRAPLELCFVILGG